jgi:hypothetical protein
MSEIQRSHLESDDDIEQILRIAVSKAGVGDNRSLRERLMMTANELGLSEEQVIAAEKEWEERKLQQRELSEFMEKERTSFFGHLTGYLIVNAFLIGIDVISDGRFEWAMWPLLGWGIGLAFHAVATFFQKSEMFQEEFQEWRKWRRERRRTHGRGRRERDDDDD